MIAGRAFAGATAALVTVGVMSASGGVSAPLSHGPAGIQGLKLVPVGDVTVRLERARNADGAPAVVVAFKKEIGTRRFVALEARPATVPAAAKALELRVRLRLTRGTLPRLAMLLFERGGGAWFKIAPLPVAAAGSAAGEFAEARVSLGALREAGFSTDPSGRLERGNVEKVWVGLVLDGPAEGSFELGRARFTDEPYRPARPYRITGDGPGKWSVGKDAAVRATLSTSDEAPGGRACMKFEFRFPGSAHMYAVPTTPVSGWDPEGYRALRFTYRASLPPGISGLLVMLIEREGAQYLVDPPPPASEKWTTVTIPFERFRLGGWSTDANGRLDLAEVASVAVAAHGTASGTGGEGTIRVTDVEFVP